MNKMLSDQAWGEMIKWIQEDRKTAKRIFELLKDVERNGYKGMGKPEALRFHLSGYWSRRINDRDRLIYKIEEQTIVLLSCRGHYDD